MPLDITEYDDLARAADGHIVMAGQEPNRAQQQLTIGPSSTPSASFGDVTRFIRVHTDAACRVSFGSAPVAGSSSMRLAAGQTEFFGVSPGLKIAVIQST